MLVVITSFMNHPPTNKKKRAKTLNNKVEEEKSPSRLGEEVEVVYLN